MTVRHPSARAPGRPAPFPRPGGDRRAGVLLIVVSAVAFGAMAILARYAYAAGTDVGALLFLRFAIAAGCMIAIMVTQRRTWPRGRSLAGMVGMGFGYVAQSFCYFTALTLASAGLVALLLYLYPALVVVLAAVVFRERFSPVRVGALALALLGSVLTIGPVGGGQLGGVLLAAGAACVYAVYILAGSRLIPAGAAVPASATVMATAAVVYGGAALAARPSFPTTAGGWAAAVAVALFSTVLAIVTFFAGLERIGPADAATLSTLEPVVTVGLAAALLGEVINAVQLAGGVCILGAVLVLARHRSAP